MKKYFAFVPLLLLLMAACKSNNDATPVTPDPNIAGTDVRDSVYYWSKVYYLWTDKLPSATVFNPTQYATPQAVIDTVKTYSPANTNYNRTDPRSSRNADRYSFVQSQKEWYNRVSGSNLDFGGIYTFVSNSDLRVRRVYADSPLGKAGVKRGWRILSLGGVDATSSANASALQSALTQNNTLSFTFQKPDGTQQTLSLTKAAFTANFIYNPKVEVANGKKIGYFYFDSFLGNNSGQATIDQLKTAISTLASQQLDGLVVDLRYNGGGYNVVQEALANLLAPASAKGKRMYSYQWNADLQAYFDQRNQININFDNQASTLNLSKIVFITSYNTASASELLINNLKPYLDVKLVGDKTYGKPVGFPVIDINMSRTDSSKNVVVAPVAFRTVNSQGIGDFYYGIDVDKLQNDDATHDFGDPLESCFKDALRYLSLGSFVRTSSETVKMDESLKQLNRTFDTEPIGMFVKIKK